jgi:hypothetical protein
LINEWRMAAVLLALGVAGAGCSSSGNVGNASTNTASIPLNERFSSLFATSSPAASSQAAAETALAETDCPALDIRQGASTLIINAPSSEPSAMTVRYQTSFTRAARECSVIGRSMSMKIGVQGRIIVGPAGGPGKLDVPLRIALVHEGPQPKTITTKLQRIPVTISEGQRNVAFTHIEEGFSFALPPRGELQSYIVYIGFDPIGATQEDRRRRPPPRQKQ